MGPRRPALRHPDHLVPGRRRSLHRLHLHRRPGARLRRRRDRLLRGALHHHHLSDPVHRVSAAVERLSQARLRDRRRLRARAVRQPLARARGDRHRHRRHHALHRAATRRPAGRDRGDGRDRRRLGRRHSADHRLPDPRRLHLFERPAGAGDDRGRQGYADLHHGIRRGDHHPDAARRLGEDLLRGAAGEADPGDARRATPPAPTASTRRSRSARRWRCCSIPTR